MRNKVLGLVGTLLAVFVPFLIFVAMQPSEFRVARTVTIAAPAEKIFPLVNDLHKSASWSPWDRLDPLMKKRFSGPTSGVGAVYSWQGNEQVGSGRMTMLESVPNERVKMKLENFKPFESVSTTEVVLKPQGSGTSVQWSLNGHKEFSEKACCLVLNMDKALGPTFEQGLSQLKTLAESSPKTDTASTGTPVTE